MPKRKMRHDCENLAPQTLSLLARELKKLASNPPDGVKYIPQADNLSEIHAELEGPEGTAYEGGVFHIKLVIGQNFPSAPPRGFFLTRIFHPNVSKNGDICVNTLKKDWKQDVGLKHILQVQLCFFVELKMCMTKRRDAVALEHHFLTLSFCYRLLSPSFPPSLPPTLPLLIPGHSLFTDRSVS